MNKKLYEQVWDEIKKAQKILLIGHRKPDGDALGSMCAMKSFLEQMGKEVKMGCVDKPTQKYAFLPYFEWIGTEIEPSQADLVIILDCGAHYMTNFHEKYPELIPGIEDAKNVVGDVYADENYADKVYTDEGVRFARENSQKKPFIINIDHHSSNDNFGHLNIVEPESASTTLILYKIFKYLDVQITSQMATCLLTGIYNDTGSFMHSNTSKEALDASAELLRLGAKISPMIKSLFKSNSIETLKLWGKVFANSKITEDNYLISVVRREDIDDDKDMDHLSGAIDYLNMVPGVDYTMLIKEDRGHIKGSLRTRRDDIDLSEIAKKYGGGGHSKAAGFSIESAEDLADQPLNF